ncbi:MAG: FtsQ-type POTRA domain-containing protein [Leptospira sp.]|nr:FtsQ-type POTRA domain-containing protein [Leptospira sp.]
MRHNFLDILEGFKDKRIKSFFLVVLVACVLFAVYEFGVKQNPSVPDVVNKLVIVGHNKLTTKEIVEILGIQAGVSFENYNLKELESKLQSHLRVKMASITRKKKEQLLISITEKNAKFIFHTNGHLYEVDEDLSVISVDDIRDPSLCVITGDFKIESNLVVGANAKDITDSVSNSFELYPAIKDRISEIVKNKDGEILFYVHSPQKIKVQMGSTLDKKQIRKLYAALAFFENQNKKVRLLDLRGDDAVYH